MEANKTNPILVPYDFTDISDTALFHAAHIAQLKNLPLILLNIFEKSTQNFLNKHKGKTLNEYMENICEKYSKEFDIKVGFIIKKEKVLLVSETAKELNISYMFIGIDQSHTAASKLLRMLGNSPAPVYVVHENVEWRDIKTIVFPVDSFKETIQKTSCAIKIAKHTNATIRLFSITLKDSNLQTIQEKRVKQIQQLLTDNGVNFITDFASRDEKNFPDELSDYAKKNNADLFILMKTPKKFLANILTNPVDIKFLFNSQNTPSIYVNRNNTSLYEISWLPVIAR